MSRSRLTESEKRQWIALFNDYDLSAAAFCREFKLPYGSFMAWKRAYKNEPKKAAEISRKAEFVELVVEQPQRSTTSHSHAAPVAELSLGSGVVLRVFTTGSTQG